MSTLRAHQTAIYQALTTAAVAYAASAAHWAFGVLIVGISVGIRWIISEVNDDDIRKQAYAMETLKSRQEHELKLRGR